MKHLIFPMALTAILGLSGAGLVLYAWQLPPFSSHTASTENAYVRGKVTTLSAQESGVVSEIFVHDFQSVKAGDALIRLDDAEARQAVLQAEADLAAARADLITAEQALHSTQKARASDAQRLETARLSLETSQNDAARQKALRETGVISEAAKDKADLELRKAETALAQLDADLASIKEQISGLEAQVEAAKSRIARYEAALVRSKITLDHRTIVAPTDGTLGQITARVGQYVAQGGALTSHVGPDRWVIANFTETSLPLLKLGQKVRISVDALGGAELDGHIDSFSPATSSEFSLMAGTNATGNFTKVVQRIPVRIEFDATAAEMEGLAPGMSVVVDAF